MRWHDTTLGEVADLISGGTPSKERPDYWDGDIPWVSAKDLKHNYIFDSELHVTEVGAANGTKIVPANTVLFVVRGMSLANEFRISLSKVPVAFNQDLKALRPRADVDPGFLFYALFAQRDSIRQRTGEASHGTKKLETEVAKAIEIRMPRGIVEQRRVASIAEQYDLLIVNNRRRIELLEQSARMLFKEWFVWLRYPGHEHDKIADGVPVGWEKKRIEELAKTIGGGTPSTAVSNYWEGGDVTWFIPTDITNNDCLILLESERNITEAGLKNSSARILPRGSILMTSRASVGFFGIYDEGDCCTNQGFISIVPSFPHARMYMLHDLMRRKEEIVGKAGGTTYKEINKTTFRNMTMLIPSNELLQEFEEFCVDIFEQVRALKRQSHTATTARDLLLPRLMDGRIPV
jgi:type I restriction enzyme, S subunit